MCAAGFGQKKAGLAGAVMRDGEGFRVWGLGAVMRVGEGFRVSGLGFRGCDA